MLVKIIGALLLLGLCIFIHELGHLLFGMMVGVRAKVFSLGYGKGIWKKEWRGTTYQITAIPLGGYVQFYGHDYHDELTHKGGEFMALSPLKRIVPILGGPLFNLLLGGLIYFFLSFAGVQTYSNEIALPSFTGSEILASYRYGLQDGDKILSINDKPTPDFKSIRTQIVLSSSDKPLHFKIERKGKIIEKDIISNINADKKMPFIGVEPLGKREVAYAGRDELKKNGEGFRKGDIIISIDGKKVGGFSSLKKILSEKSGREVVVKVKRKTAEFFSPWQYRELEIKRLVKPAKEFLFTKIRDDILPSLTVASRSFLNTQAVWKNFIPKLQIEKKKIQSEKELLSYLKKHKKKRYHFTVRNVSFTAVLIVKKRGLLGIPISERLIPKKILSKTRTLSDKLHFVYSSIESDISITLIGLGKLVSGKISARESLGGPIEIVSQASQALEAGVKRFLEFMAYISVILAVMNLLPLPIVDGGNILFFLIEAVRGKPLSVRVMDVITRTGMAFLFTLGIFVMINDIIRNIFN